MLPGGPPGGRGTCVLMCVRTATAVAAIKEQFSCLICLDSEGDKEKGGDVKGHRILIPSFPFLSVRSGWVLSADDVASEFLLQEQISLVQEKNRETTKKLF